MGDVTAAGLQFNARNAQMRRQSTPPGCDILITLAARELARTREVIQLDEATAIDKLKQMGQSHFEMDSSGSVIAIRLVYARVTDADFDLFTNFPKLKRLDVLRCLGISVAAIPSLAKLAALEELDLTSTVRIDTIGEFEAALPHITVHGRCRG